MLTRGLASSKGDVWTIGMILLVCMSLEFDIEQAQHSKQKLIEIQQQTSKYSNHNAFRKIVNLA
jgi:hypothetical protein